MKPTCVDDASPSGSYAKAIARAQKAQEANARIIAMNARIKTAYRLGTCPHQIAETEGVGVDYVRVIGGRWEQ